MPFTNSLRTCWLWAVVLCAICETQLASVPQMELHAHKISQNNNTEYVRDVMRYAKAAEMCNYMQPEVDACDDFFRYACGNWAKINPTDASNSHETNLFTRLLSTYNQKQLNVLTDTEQTDDGDVASKLRRFFGACRHLDSKQTERYKLKLWEIADEFGQMPALMPEGTWQANEFDWLTTIARIQKQYGLNIILQLGVRPDFVDKTTSKIFIGQPTLALQSRAMYKSPATKWHRDKYQTDVGRALQKYLGIQPQVAANAAREILYFESRLADGVVDKRLGKTLRSMTVLRTVDEMRAVYGGAIDINAYLNITLGQEFNGTFYEYHVDYQRNLVQMLKEIPKEQVANYIMYQLLQTFFFDYNATNGAKEKLCLDKTKVYFANVLDHIIFHKYNKDTTAKDVDLMWRQMKLIFKEQLESDEFSWIATITRKVALDKLAAMRLEVNSYDDSKFNEEYANLSLSNTDYVENLKQVHTYQRKRALANLQQAAKSLGMPTALSLSPAYIGAANLIKIPVMLLQPNILWSEHYPNALKFATLGYLVAHELIHGFDDMGRNFDPAGSEQDWWDANSTNAFNERKKCFKRQYALYRYNGKYLPESELQAENIADNGGLQLAYSAYQKWLASLNETPSPEREQLLALETLPNMGLTNRQLFFLAFAQYWCNDVDEHYRDKMSLINIHAPAKYRVIGSLANFRAFADQFQCIVGSTMNPQHKCKIY